MLSTATTSCSRTFNASSHLLLFSPSPLRFVSLDGSSRLLHAPLYNVPGLSPGTRARAVLRAGTSHQPRPSAARGVDPQTVPPGVRFTEAHFGKTACSQSPWISRRCAGADALVVVVVNISVELAIALPPLLLFLVLMGFELEVGGRPELRDG